MPRRRKQTKTVENKNEDTPPPPFAGIKGDWVTPKAFHGQRQSFGFFQCEGPKCKKSWTSAHAQSRFKQGCKACECWNLPKYMWQNEPGSQRDQEDDQRHGKQPHDSDRCEACQAGECSSG